MASVAALLLVACGADEAVESLQQESVEEQAADPYRLSTNVMPVAQQVTLNIDPDKADYSGHTTIQIEVAGESADIRLHAQEMEITSLRLYSNDSVREVSHTIGEHGLLTISANSVFEPGRYELYVEFNNNFNEDGVGLFRTEMEGENYVASQFEAIDARRAFPCFDEPGFKFPWQLTMTVPRTLTAITNTPEISVTEQGDSKTVVFDTTPPLSSYLIAVVVGPYEMVPIEGMSIPGHVAVPRGKSHLAAAALETTPPLLAYLEDYFGQPYPFKKLDLVAVNMAFDGAMEHPGAITYADFFLLLDENAATSQRSTLIKITAHELAHQWFGNLVTMQWWNDLWLNESFADWMGDKTAEAVYMEYNSELAELRTQFFVMNSDEQANTKPIRHDFAATDNFQDGIFLSYYKGKAVLDMFEEAVTPEIFRDGVIRYLRKFSRQNAQAENLWAEINAGAEFDLATGIASFIDQPGMPLVTVNDLGDGRFEFAQSRIVTGGMKIDQQWIIPLSYRYSVGDSVRTAQLVIDEAREIVQIDGEVDWVLPNADQRGYFRWSIPQQMLSQLGEDASTHLNVRERMGLLSNLWALLGADKLDGDEYLAAMKSLSSDMDADVLRALVSQLSDLRRTFITPDLEPQFADFLRDMFAPVLERIGSSPLPDDSNAVADLRPQILLWLSAYGQDADARAVISRTVERFLAGKIPMSESVDVALRSLPRWSDSELFEIYRDRVAKAGSPAERRSLVRGLGTFRRPEVVSEVLDYVLVGEELRAGEIAAVLAGLFAAEANNAMLLDWAMQHDAELRSMLSDGQMVGMPGRLMTCSTDKLEFIADFYAAPERFVGGIESEIEEKVGEKTAFAAFRQREQASVREYLSAHEF
jgi:alanyl aminopeptidase